MGIGLLGVMLVAGGFAVHAAITPIAGEPAPAIAAQPAPSPKPIVSAPVAAPAPAVSAPATPPVPVPSPTPVAAAPAGPQPYVVHHILPIKGAMHHGDWYWDESGAPQNGPILITVDLEAQVLSIFRGGWEIGTAVILYGADAKPTPLGTYPITQKDADHVSNIYQGAPMPYMLRLTNDGVSIHGSKVIDGYMTHGCIGVPIAFAKKLYGAVKVGDRVIVTRGKLIQPDAATKDL
jgi:lipoprotein-anchoring transpeptidase ErfK/SrfK